MRLDIRSRNILDLLVDDLNQKPGVVIGAALKEFSEKTPTPKQHLACKDHAIQIMCDLCDEKAGKKITL
jgi:hypothetical protein